MAPLKEELNNYKEGERERERGCHFYMEKFPQRKKTYPVKVQVSLFLFNRPIHEVGTLAIVTRVGENFGVQGRRKCSSPLGLLLDIRLITVVDKEVKELGWILWGK